MQLAFMRYLIPVTLLWAFSFSIIGTYLAGQVDVHFAVLTRISLALCIFLPLLKLDGISGRYALALMAIGACQIGLMYLFFYQAFLFLSVPEILLFSIVTPVYITLLSDGLHRRLSPRHLLMALLAVAGAAVIRYTRPGDSIWIGFMIMQAANLCFALGQVGYRHLSMYWPVDTAGYRSFGWFFLGAWPVAALSFIWLGDTQALPATIGQWTALLWLGVVASGLGYYAWNRGASQVDAGTLALMNNALIPAGLAVNLLLLGTQDIHPMRLILGAAIMLTALGLNHYGPWSAQRRPRN